MARELKEVQGIIFKRQKYILVYTDNPNRCKEIVFDDDYYVVDYVNSIYGEIVQDSLGRKLLENEFDVAKDVLLCAGLKVVKLG